MRRACVWIPAALAVAACAVDPGPVDRAETERFDARRLAMQGDYEAAETLLREAREQYPDSSLGAAHIDVALGELLLKRSLHDRELSPEAKSRFEGALEIATRVEDSELITDATIGLGHYAYKESPEMWDEALETFERALALAEESSDSLDMARAHYRIGLVHQRMSRFEAAEPHFEDAIDLAGVIGAKLLIGDIERHVGFQRYLQGDQDGALPHFEASFEARREAGDLGGAIFAQVTLGWALIQLGRDAEAVAQLEEAVSRAETFGSPEAELRAHNDLVTAFRNLGEAEKAREHALEAARIRQEMGWADPAASGPGPPADSLDPGATDPEAP